MNFQLRPALESDGDFLFAVFHENRAPVFAAAGWAHDQVDALLREQHRFREAHYRRAYPDASCEIVVVDGVAAGRLCVDRGELGLHLIDVALLAAFRGQGLGGDLLGRLTAEADAAGKAMRLMVEDGNPARRLYRKHGFQEQERQGVHLLMVRPPVRSDR